MRLHSKCSIMVLRNFITILLSSQKGKSKTMKSKEAKWCLATKADYNPDWKHCVIMTPKLTREDKKARSTQRWLHTENLDSMGWSGISELFRSFLLGSAQRIWTAPEVGATGLSWPSSWGGWYVHVRVSAWNLPSSSGKILSSPSKQLQVKTRQKR